jgi:hypothetical protein
MQKMMNFKQSGWRKLIVLTLSVLLSVFSLLTVSAAPSYAADNLTPADKIDRAYKFSEDTGIEEEVYQRRLEEGQDPEAMPKPYKRIKNAEGQLVPETSLLETTVEKTREFVENIGK